MLSSVYIHVRATNRVSSTNGRLYLRICMHFIQQIVLLHLLFCLYRLNASAIHPVWHRTKCVWVRILLRMHACVTMNDTVIDRSQHNRYEHTLAVCSIRTPMAFVHNFGLLENSALVSAVCVLQAKSCDQPVVWLALSQLLLLHS